MDATHSGLRIHNVGQVGGRTLNDRGHAGVELALAAGLLLLPVAIAVMSFGPWSETRVDAEALAAEAARAAVLALDLGHGEAQVASGLTTFGLEDSNVRVGWCGADPEPLIGGGSGSCSFGRGSVVSVSIELWTPLIATPWGAIGGLWVEGEHSEPIDLYRSLG